ncbi:glycosyltransferase family 2 protein [Methylobacterium nonmethylotrophicum]|uniref:Glycosyltransferase family 2 protein n=1 Tax=Methylobacterium nonmethylotrophicum TaxID=1141884 RepID=A0A4Z0NSY3_9HYPH|nr:glycosyltransferase [Methylobacterium nonmethylotrophicum]TGD99476.1 glycosyltransferase family 2 protein [Methylobacterium nonmethylotrophicum]
MKPRVLHAITIYNGRDFVPKAIDSALRIDQSEADIDVLVLDDASPEPGFSEMIEDYCRQRGALYYRTPRNLGIPRNVNLGLLTAVQEDYDYVVINNSDVIFPRNLINSMIGLFTDPTVGSVTAWSNNVSIYSIPNADPDRYLSAQSTVDFISDTFHDVFGGEATDIPAGISFCIMIPAAVIRQVGLMDPIFGRGYCEETDWSLRSLKAGYRICLAPGTFVYHMGRGSNLAAGLVSAHHTTVPENEAVIDVRHPDFRKQVLKFEEIGTHFKLKEQAIIRLVGEAAKVYGYMIQTGWSTDVPDVDDDMVRVRILDNDKPSVVYSYRGFEHSAYVTGTDVTAQIVSRFDGLKPRINMYDPKTDSDNDAGTKYFEYDVNFWVEK